MEKEWIIAIVVSVTIATIIAFFIMKRYGFLSNKAITIDSIVGEKCLVTEKIDNFAGCGQVRVKGQFWSARGFYDDDVFECGESLRIVAIEGVMVVCKKD